MRRCSRLFNPLLGLAAEMQPAAAAARTPNLARSAGPACGVSATFEIGHRAAADKPPTSNPIEDLAECESDLPSLLPPSN